MIAARRRRPAQAARRTEVAVAKFLSQEWLEQQCRSGPVGPGGSGVSGRVQWLVTGGPDGDVTYHTVLEDGAVVAAGLGADPDAELSLTAPYEVAAAIATGELDPAIAYMRGRLKAEGRSPTLYALLAFAQSEEGRATTKRLAAMTGL